MVATRKCWPSDLTTMASTDFKASSGNSKLSHTMTMGIWGLTCLISEATTAPSSKPRWYSITTASTACDIKSRKPSTPQVAVKRRYPFCFRWSNCSGSRCMQSKVL